MASRLDLAQQYVDYFAAQNTDETLAMMSDDAVLSNPMTQRRTARPRYRRNSPPRPGGAAA